MSQCGQWHTGSACWSKLGFGASAVTGGSWRDSLRAFQLWPADHVIAVMCSQGDKGGNISGTSFPSWALTAEETPGLALPQLGKGSDLSPRSNAGSLGPLSSVRYKHPQVSVRHEDGL